MTRLGQEVSGIRESNGKRKDVDPQMCTCAAEPSGGTNVLHPGRGEHWKCRFTVATGKLWERDGSENFRLFCALDGLEAKKGFPVSRYFPLDLDSSP